MTIIANVPNHDNSPWYSIMEKKAMSWNEFSEKEDMKIKGSYNAHIVEFKAINSDKNIIIKGYRQLSNVTNYIYPFHGRISERLMIKLDSIMVDEKSYVKIIRKNLLNRFKRKLKFRNKNYKGFIITYNTQYSFQKIKESGILNYENLVSLNLKKRKFKLIINELPCEINEINKLASLWKLYLKKDSKD